MKHRKKNVLRALTKHIGVTAKFVTYLPVDVHGRLLVRERRILINAHKPRTEHVYTLLHEIAHYLLHQVNPRPKRHPWICDIDWKNKFLVKICSQVRRYFRYVFNRTKCLEWEADLWAMCAFVLLAKSFGFRDDLFAFLKRHPEKWRMFLMVRTVVPYCDAKTRIKNFINMLLLPFTRA